MPLRSIAVIPARFGSQRLPGKPLARIGEKPLVQHVYERVAAVRGLARVCVATDDERIEQAVRAFGGEVVRTRTDHRCGTDRVAEVAAADPAEIVVNVQGDMPFLSPRAVEELVARMAADPSVPMATVATPLDDRAAYESPHVVKVVMDRSGRALYFSRSPVPYWRDCPSDGTAFARKHVGLYAFRRDFLLRFTSLEPTPLERAESLEQLRALEHGFPIAVVEVDLDIAIEVDTPEDLERARAVWEEAGERLAQKERG